MQKSTPDMFIMLAISANEGYFIKGSFKNALFPCSREKVTIFLGALKRLERNFLESGKEYNVSGTVYRVGFLGQRTTDKKKPHASNQVGGG